MNLAFGGLLQLLPFGLGVCRGHIVNCGLYCADSRCKCCHKFSHRGTASTEVIGRRFTIETVKRNVQTIQRIDHNVFVHRASNLIQPTSQRLVRDFILTGAT